MSTLHERLLAEPDIWTREAQSDPTGAVDRLAAAVRAAVERHTPVPRSLLDGGGFCCPVCVEHCSELGEHTCVRGNVEAPCDEIKSIAEALGIGETPK